MGGGKERKATQDRQLALQSQQQKTADMALNNAKVENDRRLDLQKPAIDYYKGLTSNDPNMRLTAAAAPIGDISRMGRSTSAAIADNVPRGAARDFAQSQVPQNTYAQSAGYLNQAFNNAFPALANIGTESGGVGLQYQGAGLRGLEGAGQTNDSIARTQQQQKASQLGVLGSLAGVAGNIATGGMSGMAGGAAKSFNPLSMFKGKSGTGGSGSGNGWDI